MNVTSLTPTSDGDAWVAIGVPTSPAALQLLPPSLVASTSAQLFLPHGTDPSSQPRWPGSQLIAAARNCFGVVAARATAAAGARAAGAAWATEGMTRVVPSTAAAAAARRTVRSVSFIALPGAGTSASGLSASSLSVPCGDGRERGLRLFVQPSQEVQYRLVDLLGVGDVRGVRCALDEGERDRAAQAGPDRLGLRHRNRRIGCSVEDERRAGDLAEAAGDVIPVHQAPERPGQLTQVMR